MKVNLIIKFIIATAIFYALLACNIFHIGEFLVPNDKDYSEIYLPEEEQEPEETNSEIDSDDIEEETGHFAWSSATNLANLCKRIPICDKIQFKGSFTSTEKYAYTKGITRIVQFIDDKSTQTKDIKEVIDTIEINKENGKRRWYATWDSIIFNIWLVQWQKEFFELSTHEMGHIVDLWYIQWSSSRKERNFTEFGKVVFAINDPSLSFYRLSRNKETIRKAEAKKKDFCSGYGMTDPFEDFSECFNLYTNHNSFFRQISKTNTVLKKKYNFIATIVSGYYMNANSQDLELIKTNTLRRPRDTTKLAN